MGREHPGQRRIETQTRMLIRNRQRTTGKLKPVAWPIIGSLFHALDQRRAMAWVLGAEGDGMRRLTRETCDELVSIPMLGSVESLNVSVSAGVCLYETVRQRRAK